jgi:hypothetical protein
MKTITTKISTVKEAHRKATQGLNLTTRVNAKPKKDNRRARREGKKLCQQW